MFLAQALRQGSIFDVFTGGPRARTVTVICALRLDATHALARANELSSTFKAAARSTLSPDTDPARLRPTACASPRPNHIQTAQNVHQTTRAARKAKRPHMAAATAPGTTRARNTSSRAAQAVQDGSCAARRLDHHQDVCGLSSACPLLLVVLGLRSTAPGRS
mmetsp:Transcript_73540/g.221007  ORF Transcript_73540/g.221007 Transcript_73540/m.221007 type:complete len:163 (-) Transcript_73540:168-656(-)